MAATKIAFLNASTVVNDADAIKVMNALNKQVKQDYAPVWGTDADLEFFNDPHKIPKNYWWLIILDDSDAAGALGYHDLTKEGLPLGKIFAKTDLTYGTAWSVTASHELLEMMEDPDINLMVYRIDENSEAFLVAYEVCDACEADKFGYKIDSVLVSDFVYPSWFEDFEHPAGTIFNHGKNITKPFELLDGGYIGVNKIDTSEGWTQLYGNAKGRKYNMRPLPGSRRERRRTLKSNWLKSEIGGRIKEANKTKRGKIANKNS